MVLVFSKMAFVIDSGAGPPFGVLNLMPKSSSGPPGLCDAVRRIAPKQVSSWVFRLLIW